MNNLWIVIILRRILFSIILVFFLISFLFVLVRLSPGDPVQKFVSPDLNPAIAIQVAKSFSLDDSMFTQYISFFKNLATGNMGVSYTYRQPVTSVILNYLPFTMMLAFLSLTLQICVSFMLAILLYNRKSKIVHQLSKFLLSLYSIPSFIIGLFLIFVFSYKLQLLPSSELTNYSFNDVGFLDKMIDYSRHLILPLITLSLGGVILLYKYLSEQLKEVSTKTFVIKLRAEGISENKILLHHIIPNAINPIITLIGIELGLLLSGALITEVIFALPGMGRLTINAILWRDYPLIIGCVFLSALFVVLANFGADILRASFDKRYAIKLLK